MRKEILQELESVYTQRRAENDQVFFQRREEIARICPEIPKLMDARQQLIFSSIRGILDRNMVEDVPEKMQAISLEIQNQLTAHGYPADYLEPQYHCPICQDKGYVGDGVRDMCACMRKEMYQRLYAAVGLSGANDASFEQFDLKVFPDTPIPELGCSQRQMMGMLQSRTEAWADTWPEVPKKSGILFSGSSGLGKTYLMHCIARRLLERDKEVLVISSYRAQEIMRNAYITREEDDLQMLMDVDILCLDDLGTEPLMENITITQLFNLLNERKIRGKACIVSTNLSPRNLRERYTERITSRLLDQTSMEIYEMRGQDIRRK